MFFNGLNGAWKVGTTLTLHSLLYLITFLVCNFRNVFATCRSLLLHVIKLTVFITILILIDINLKVFSHNLATTPGPKPSSRLGDLE
jgi:hypothetical protein